MQISDKGLENGVNIREALEVSAIVTERVLMLQLFMDWHHVDVNIRVVVLTTNPVRP